MHMYAPTCFPVYLAVLLIAFTAPKVYELKKTEIDGLLQKANSQLQQLYKKLDDTVLKSELLLPCDLM